MKHTPGPWNVIGNIICTNKGTTVAVIQHVWSDDKETSSNGRLIAAAPELLEALERLLRADEKPPTEEQAEEAIMAMGNARRIIQKAKGEA